MSATDSIRKVEERWLMYIIPFVKETFKDIWLPSHDHTHAIRTWNFAKELIILLNKNNFHIDKLAIEKVLFAAFFHDAGMSKSIEIQHGKISREICEDFFKTKPKLKPGGINEILEAIEYHDDKSYRNEVFAKTPNKFDTLSILSIADDLDSFGFFGVFRFWEINVLREYPIENIPQKVLTSLKSRINHLNSTFSFCPKFFDHQEARYQITRNFFLDLKENYQLSKNSNINLLAQDIVELFNEIIIQGMNSPDKILPLIQTANLDSEVHGFFKNLIKDYNHQNSQ